MQFLHMLIFTYVDTGVVVRKARRHASEFGGRNPGLGSCSHSIHLDETLTHPFVSHLFLQSHTSSFSRTHLISVTPLPSVPPSHFCHTSAVGPPFLTFAPLQVMLFTPHSLHASNCHAPAQQGIIPKIADIAILRHDGANLKRTRRSQCMR